MKTGLKFTTVCGMTGESFTFDWDSLPESSQLAIVQYGFNQNVGQDSVASCTKKAYPDSTARLAKARELSRARAESVRQGTMGSGKSAIVATLAAEILALKAELAKAQAVAAATPEPAKKGRAA